MLDKSQLSQAQGSNLSTEEITRFDQMAEAWWDPNGAYKHVLAFNHCRLDFIQGMVVAQAARQEAVLTDMRLLDIGCGGGLLCEPFASQGMAVTGVDASGVSIEVARRHALGQGLQIDYQHCLASELDPEQQYDVVLNTEVIEHVPDQKQLIADCAARVAPGGLLVMATLNKTWKSFLFGIVGAEYVLRLLPRGTHDWRYFVTPQDMSAMVSPHGFVPVASSGMSFNPLSKKWRLSKDMKVNYLMAFRRT